MKLLSLLMLWSIISCDSIPDEKYPTEQPKVKQEFRTHVSAIMEKHKIPGGVIGISRNHDMKVFSFGLVDKERLIPTQASSKFRIASISKPITAVGILLLIERKKLGLDDRIVEILKEGGFEVENTIDPNWRKITVYDLLCHTGGWEHYDHNDPMLNTKPPKKQAVSKPLHIQTNKIINEALKTALDHTPGSRYNYSNLGYHILGRIIEIKSGLSYGEFIHNEVLVPLKMKHTFLGKTALQERLEGESKYYDYPNAPKVESVFSTNTVMVPGPYGGFCLEILDSNGGWVSTAEDLLKFINNLELLLKAETINKMLSPPAYLGVSNTNSYYAMGWNVAKVNQGSVIWHTGSLAGTCATLVQLDKDTSFVAIFNSRDSSFTFLNEINDRIIEFIR